MSDSSIISIKRKNSIHGTVHQLPSSKSISNRAILINALSGNQSVVSNLSVARDTDLMKSLINSPDEVIDVMDAGTTMRFLTAYFALSGQKKMLTGTARMKERPIGLLVDSLRSVGAVVNYAGKPGFPPIETGGFGGQKADVVSLPGNVSSQYVSALMMVAPILPRGLTIQLEGPVGSRPYIEMTVALMRQFGAECTFRDQTIHVAHSPYRSTRITVESDWSATSYWLAFVALAETAELTLPNVSAQSLQGDRVITEVMTRLGVRSEFRGGSLVLTKTDAKGAIEWDFKDCPDLAQTVLPVCAAKGIAGNFTGLESLRIKETDRIAALQTELARIGASLAETNGRWSLTPGKVAGPLEFRTYHDHRMAMGLAPLAALADISIHDPDVVNKSYPGFWSDMKSLGFDIHERLQSF